MIFITAHPEETALPGPAPAGATLVRKPFDDRDLVAALRRAIGAGFDPAGPRTSNPADSSDRI